MRLLIDRSDEVAHFTRRATQGTFFFFFFFPSTMSSALVQSVRSGAAEYLQCRGLDALPSISHVSA